jgi:hypothetical protein
MTRREKLERRLERRREWATARDRDANARFNNAARAVDGIPPGQPILVGHHSERHHRAALDRHDTNMRKGVEAADMASRHRSAAGGLADALDRSIFSDDEDAISRLEERIAEREAERSRLKAYNASARAAAKRGGTIGDTELLDEAQRASLLSVARHAPYQLRKGGQFPSYALTNLGKSIKADRDRIATIKARVAKIERAWAAGGVLIERSHENNWVTVTFAEKPDREVLDILRASKLSYGGGSWGGYLDTLPPEIEALEDLS